MPSSETAKLYVITVRAPYEVSGSSDESLMTFMSVIVAILRDACPTTTTDAHFGFNPFQRGSSGTEQFIQAKLEVTCNPAQLAALRTSIAQAFEGTNAVITSAPRRVFTEKTAVNDLEMTMTLREWLNSRKMTVASDLSSTYLQHTDFEEAERRMGAYDLKGVNIVTKAENLLRRRATRTGSSLATYHQQPLERIPITAFLDCPMKELVTILPNGSLQLTLFCTAILVAMERATPEHAQDQPATQAHKKRQH